jgi:hypothetical protein
MDARRRHQLVGRQGTERAGDFVIV